MLLHGRYYIGSELYILDVCFSKVGKRPYKQRITSTTYHAGLIDIVWDAKADHNKELWEKLMNMYNDYFKTQEVLFTTIRDNKHNIADHQQRHFGLQTLQRAHSFLSFKI